MSNNKKNPTTALVKRAQPRFIPIDEICIDKLSLYATAVYMQLRLLSDFSKDCDEIKITIGCLAEKSKMSERKVYQSLNELEFEHHLVQRLNYHHFRYGKINSYNVARDYGYFKNSTENIQIDQRLNTPAQNDMGVQNLHTPAPRAVTPAPRAVTPAQNDIPKETRILSTIKSKKHNKDAVDKPVSVFVFSCFEDVKDRLLEVIAKRNLFIEDEICAQIMYYIGNEKNAKAVDKKINVALKLVREGKWNIPQGFEGITSQSIREDEEIAHEEKQEIYAQDAKAFQTISSTVAGEGLKGFSAMLQKLKDDVYGKGVNQGTVPENDIRHRLKVGG